MNSTSRAVRPLQLIGVAALAIAIAGSGCGWIKNKTNYQSSRESNPLEVPPDLDRPDSSSATAMPVVSSAGAPAAAAAGSSDGRLSIPASEAYPKIGEILASMPGVSVNGRAEALSSYDVSYKGESFLLRVLDATGGSRMVALSPDGRMLNSGAPAELMAALKSKF